ncbi:MAG: antitoxin MazE-like protein [Ignavibacteriales bacterium]
MATKPKPAASPNKNSAARTRAYRERLRAKGMRPVTVWTYDRKDPAFRKQLEDDFRRIRESPGEKEIMDWIEAVLVEDGYWD